MHIFYTNFAGALTDALADTTNHDWFEAKQKLEYARNLIAYKAGNEKLDITLQELIKMGDYWKLTNDIALLISDAKQAFLDRHSKTHDHESDMLALMGSFA